MYIKKTERTTPSIRISINTDNEEVGHCYLLLGFNDNHPEPFALLEDVFVNEAWREKGIGRQLVESAIKHAQNEGAYKLIASVRAENHHLLAWYESIGLNVRGHSLRLDL